MRKITKLPDEFFIKLRQLDNDPDFPNHISDDDPRLLELHKIIEDHEKQLERNKLEKHKQEYLALAREKYKLQDIAVEAGTTISKLKNEMRGTNFSELYKHIREDIKSIFCFNVETEEVKQFTNKSKFINFFHIKTHEAKRYINTYKVLENHLVFDYDLWRKVGV